MLKLGLERGVLVLKLGDPKLGGGRSCLVDDRSCLGDDRSLDDQDVRLVLGRRRELERRRRRHALSDARSADRGESAGLLKPIGFLALPLVCLVLLVSLDRELVLFLLLLVCFGRELVLGRLGELVLGRLGLDLLLCLFLGGEGLPVALGGGKTVGFFLLLLLLLLLLECSDLLL